MSAIVFTCEFFQMRNEESRKVILIFHFSSKNLFWLGMGAR